MGVELVHSHHAWVDANVCIFLKDDPDTQLIVTSHGMYETLLSRAGASSALYKKRVNKFIYIADKNLSPFVSSSFDMTRFVKIDNTSDIVPISPVPRSEIDVPENAFLVCLVSRAIPEKGWQEAIDVIKLAREISQKDIHLLLIGSGLEYERLKPVTHYPYIHLLGFRPNSRDYFAASAFGFLPHVLSAKAFRW